MMFKERTSGVLCTPCPLLPLVDDSGFLSLRRSVILSFKTLFFMLDFCFGRS